MMSIIDLSQKTLEKLYTSLEGVETLNWKKLMKRFASLHSEDNVAIIEGSSRPAKALLDDLTGREIPLQDLLEALEDIGNKRAASIVRKGAQKNGLDMQLYSGRRLPPEFRGTGIPQEQEDSIDLSLIQCGEQAESSRKPVQV